MKTNGSGKRETKEYNVVPRGMQVRTVRTKEFQYGMNGLSWNDQNELLRRVNRVVRAWGKDNRCQTAKARITVEHRDQYVDPVARTYSEWTLVIGGIPEAQETRRLVSAVDDVILAARVEHETKARPSSQGQ